MSEIRWGVGGLAPRPRSDVSGEQLPVDLWGGQSPF